MSEYKFTHKTIIDQHDYIRLVQELAYKMYSIVVENDEDKRHEYEDEDGLTSKGEDVLSQFEDDVVGIINFELQIVFDGKKSEWRTKESLLEKPF